MRRIFPLVLLVLLAGAACGGKPFRPIQPPKAKNAILISIDMLRPDHLGCYGYDRPTSPRLDALARESIRFVRAYSSANWTLPGHAGMLTGRMSSWHGAIQVEDRIRDDVPLISQVLQARGVATGAITSHVFVSPRYGFARGFDTFDFEQNRPAGPLTDRAIDWLKARGDDRFFLFLHYFDVHTPYGKPGAPVAQFARDPQCRGPISVHQAVAAAYQEKWDAFACITDLYDADIALVDAELGRLFDFLRERGLLEQTLVVVTSDHGELLGRGEGVTHGLTLREPEIRVPLLLRFPGAVGGDTVVGGLVSNIQLAPTILETLDAPPFDTDLPGLLPVLTGEPAPTWVGVESDSVRYQQIGIVGERYKLVLPPTYAIMNAPLAPMLIDLTGSEEANVWNEHADLVADLRAKADASGWYGRGTAHEFVYRFGHDIGPVTLRLTYPAAQPPVYVRPWRREARIRHGVMSDVTLPIVTTPGQMEITLAPGDHTMGVIVVMPEGAQAQAELSFLSDRRPPARAGDGDEAWDGSPRDLPEEAGEWSAPPEPDGAFIRLRSYRVLDLDRPQGGRSGSSVALSDEEKRDLRALGYLGM